MKKNNQYWKDRRLQIDKEIHELTDEVQEKLTKEYKKALNTIENRLNAFYGKFAKDNSITMEQAKKLLKGEDMKSFYLELDNFTEKAKENILNENWKNELDYTSKKVRISRLESLETQIQNEIEKLINKEYLIKIALLTKAIEDTYYKNIFLTQIQTNVGFDFNILSTRSIETIMNMEWDLNNFSSRIWYNREKLIKELRTELTQSFILGESRDKAASRLAKKMGVAKNRAKALVRTESAFVSSVAKERAFKEMRSEEYEIVATLDDRTTEICQEMDGQVFKLSERIPGVTAEPFHWMCRTTSIPKVDKELITERIGKDKEGRTVYVPGDWTYEEFKNKYL